MIRFIEVETRGSGTPHARLVGPTLPRDFWWWGGVSWVGKIDGPLLVEIVTTSDRSSGDLTDFFRTTNVRIVSSRLQEVLKRASTETEFWPVTILRGQEVIQGKYYAVNSLETRRAVDTGRSIVEFDEELGDAIAVEKLILDEQKLQELRWAMVEEVHRIAVSEDVQQAITLSGCTGFCFLDPIEIRY